MTPSKCLQVVAFAVLTIALAAGCSEDRPSDASAVRPVRSMVVASGGEIRVRAFPGRVEASDRVTLAFQVPGLLASIPVKEGQAVKKGDVIAQLRQDEFASRLKALQGELDRARAILSGQLAGERPEQILRLESGVRAAEARLNRASTEFQRIRGMMENQVASRIEFEEAKTTYLVAREEHKAAIQLLEAGTIARQEDIEAQRATVRGTEARVVEANLQLEDSTIRAPYDGVIAEVFVRANQSIRPKEPVVKFQDTNEIDIALDVPESVMTADIRRAEIVEMLAEFSGARGLRFPVRIRERAQTADPVTQTFRVRVAMQSPTEVTILPGMTATVEVTYRRAGILENHVLVPITAVYKSSSGEQIAWVIGSDDIVKRRAVKLGEARGPQIEVTDGLLPGDRIAIAGVTSLRDGLKVRDLGDALGEQR